MFIIPNSVKDIEQVSEGVKRSVQGIEGMSDFPSVPILVAEDLSEYDTGDDW